MGIMVLHTNKRVTRARYAKTHGGPMKSGLPLTTQSRVRHRSLLDCGQGYIYCGDKKQLRQTIVTPVTNPTTVITQILEFTQAPNLTAATAGLTTKKKNPPKKKKKKKKKKS